MSILHRLNHLAAYPIIRLIYIYQWTLSPDKSLLFSPFLRGRICAHEPHCSAYGIQVLKHYGLFPGIIYMVDRITSCTPSPTTKHDPATLRVVFASSAPIGVPFVEKIAADPRYDLVGVVTNPDQPVGRGMKVRPNIIKTTANLLLASSSRGGTSINISPCEGGCHEVTGGSQGKPNIIIFHGKKRPQKNIISGRIKDTHKKLSSQGYTIATPHIDKTREIGRKEREKNINQHKHLINTNTILIGHSAGGAAITRRLGENDIQIKKLILVAPGKIPRERHEGMTSTQTGEPIGPHDEDGMKYLYDFTIDQQLANKTTDGIILYTSNDSERMLQSAQLYKKIHNIKHIELEDRGHFNSGYDPQNATFPELIEEITHSHKTPDSSTAFVSTPQSLRLQSKKYSQDAKDFTQRLEQKSPDLLVVIAYGKIIPQHILDIPTIAPINVHGSLLPNYRGASPIQSVLLEDEPETGITIMRMEAGLDTGPMLSKQSFPLTIHTTALDIIEKFQDFGPKQLVDTMRNYAKGHIKEIPQSEQGLPLSEGEGSGEVSHCYKLTKSDGLINPWQQSLYEINNIYRGCYLWPKAHFVLPEGRGEHIGKTITIDQMTLDESLREQHKDQPLLEKNTINPAIISLTVKPANKKAISWEDFINGYSPS